MFTDVSEELIAFFFMVLGSKIDYSNREDRDKSSSKKVGYYLASYKILFMSTGKLSSILEIK